MLRMWLVPRSTGLKGSERVAWLVMGTASPTPVPGNAMVPALGSGPTNFLKFQISGKTNASAAVPLRRNGISYLLGACSSVVDEPTYDDGKG
jgi:hypothetical protein